jgi:long-chain acyl-CoA synthetase
VHVPRDISEVLVPALDARPQSNAVTTRSGSLTYAELDALANRCGRTLQALGIRPGDRVAAALANDFDILGAFHGAMRMGAVWVGVNQALAAPEIAYILRDSGARVLLCDSATEAKLHQHLDGLPGLLIVTVGPLDALRGLDWSSLVDAQADEPLGSTVDPHSAAAIAYTSGTTGHPKGAVHSQLNLLLPGAYLVATRKYGEALRKGDCFPLTIVNMMVLTTLLTAQACGLAVIMDSLNAREIAGWIRRERVTVWNGPPALLYTMAHDDTIAPGDLRSLEEVWSGGADTPGTIREDFEEKFGVRVVGTYGLTEAPTMVAIESVRREHSSGSSGQPLPHIELSVRDGEGRVLAPGEVGEICIGPRESAAIRDRLAADWDLALGGRDLPPEYRLMLGYWRQDEQSDVSLRGGVLHTGDVGSLDAMGNLIVSDRLNLVLNRGGANIYPAEVERVALAFPAVVSCGVLGIPDPRLGQRVGMLVEFEPGADADVEALLAHCRAQMADYKVPEYVAAVEALPRNPMGKIDRRALADAGRALLADAHRYRSAHAASG